MRRVKFQIVLFLAAISLSVSAQDPYIRFHSISLEDGLSHSYVTSFLEDDLGFLWFGTQEGLNRYDGYGFKVYRAGKSNRTPSKNWITDIYKDHFNQIWIYYEGNGLDRFDPLCEVFHAYKPDSLKPGSISSDGYNSIENINYTVFLEDSDSNLWIGTDRGLNKYIREDDRFELFRHDPLDPNSLTDDRIFTMTKDHENMLWIGTYNGLNRFDPGTGRSTRFLPDPDNPNSLKDNVISEILVCPDSCVWVGTTRGGLHIIENAYGQEYRISNLIDKPLNVNLESTVYKIIKTQQGIMLVGTNQGLFQISKVDGSFSARLFPETSNIRIDHIVEDPLGFVWVASKQNIRNSLFRINPDLETIENFRYEETDPYSYKGGKIIFMDISRTGLIWIGAEKLGIYKVDLHAKKFHTIDDVPRDDISLVDKETYAIHEDAKGNLYVGTKSGLNRINLREQTVMNFRNKQEIISNLSWEYAYRLPAELIGTIAETRDHKLWMGSFDYKVSLYDPQTGRFLNFHHNEADERSFLGWSQRSICVTHDDKVYFGGTSHGLRRLDDGGKTFFYYPVVKTGDPTGTNDSEINIIREGKDGFLWLGTLKGGLNRMDPATREFTHFTSDPSNPNSISNNSVNCILEPEIHGEDILWIGTNGGLNRFDKNSGSFTLYSVEDGLPGNTIHGILEDKLGRLWLSSNQGLILFDPLTEKIRIYTVEDGLQGNEFNEGSYFKNKDGILYFGGTNGLNYFNPEEIRDNPRDARAVITDFRRYNRLIMAHDTIENRVILENSILHTEELFLTHKDKVISFEFTALDFITPAKLKYRYMLEGFDKDWNEVPSSQRFAHYTNIPSGDYTFLVLSTNSDGIPSSEPATLVIHVKPPFWETLWFLALIGIAIIGLFIAVMSIRTQVLKHQKKMLTLEVEERTWELKEANRILKDQQDEIVSQSDKITLQRDNLSNQNKLLENQKVEIQGMAEKLHESDQAKLRFFTNISHEFRTPLTLIMGPTENLLKKKDYSNLKMVKDDLSLIYRNEKRLYRLINQLLEIRHVETGTLRLSVKKNDIVGFLREIHSLFSPLAEKKHIVFQFYSELESIPIHFDADKIEKILYNLLSNAMKYAPEGGFVNMSISIEKQRKTQEMLNISVADNGPGIAAEHLPHIFDRFYQVSKSQSGNTSSGIGLSLSKDLVEKHYGKISVESEIGNGTVFDVYLPVSADVYKPEEHQSDPDHAYSLDFMKSMLEVIEEPIIVNPLSSDEEEDQFRILVVEDNIDMQQFLSRELSVYYSVMVADNGRQALVMAREHPPDLIISDIMMPEMDGLKLCKTLKSDEFTSHIPVFLLTAKSETEYQVTGLELGADDYIVKPFSIEILMLKIRNLLDNRKLAAEKFSEDANYIPRNIKISEIDQDFLEKFVKLVEDNIDSTELSGDWLAYELGMSKGNLYKKLKSLSGLTVNVYIRTIRLKIAARILKQGKYNISEVAYSVGFDNPKYFSTCFSDLFSMSPKEYMK
jgi:signal transduction histidine kinase/ligand-binding sensor domain-containing protein/DNA-binding response OmpR family regulator